MRFAVTADSSKARSPKSFEPIATCLDRPPRSGVGSESQDKTTKAFILQPVQRYVNRPQGDGLRPRQFLNLGVNAYAVRVFAKNQESR